MRRIIVVCALLVLMSGHGSAQGTVWLRASHETPSGANYPLLYGAALGSSTNLVPDVDFEGPDNGTNTWQATHVTSGCYGGAGGCLQIDRWGGVNGDPQAGYTFNTTTVAPAGGWVSALSAGPVYYRFRVKWTTGMSLTQGINSSAQMKHWITGGPGETDGNDRTIIFWERATDATYGAGTNDATQVTIRVGAGVSGDHAEAVVPVDSDWHHVQIGTCYTNACPGAPWQRIWVDNNTFAAPDAENLVFTDQSGGTWDVPTNWGTGHLHEIVSTNSYSGQDARYTYQDFEMANGFDATWAPGGSSAGPTRLRIRGEQ